MISINDYLDIILKDFEEYLRSDPYLCHLKDVHFDAGKVRISMYNNCIYCDMHMPMHSNISACTSIFLNICIRSPIFRLCLSAVET